MPTFTLASFNICSAHFREGHYTEDNLARLAAHINQSTADVVCLQEVDRGAARSDRVDMPAYLAEHTELKHRYFIKIRDFQGENTAPPSSPATPSPRRGPSITPYRSPHRAPPAATRFWTLRELP